MRSIVVGVAPALRRRPPAFGSSALGVQLSGLARRRDEPALGAGEARALGPARGDPDRHRLERLVVDRRAVRAVPPALERHPLARPELGGSAPPPRAAARAAPPSRATRCRWSDLVHRLAGAQAEEDTPGSEAAERRERLRDDRRVVAIRGRQHARADQDARGLRGQRAEPRQRGGRMAAVVPERLEVVRDRDAVEAEALRRERRTPSSSAGANCSADAL